MDITLRERAQRNKARREEMLIEIARLRQKKEIPLSRFGFKQISAFCSALNGKFRDRSSNFGKEYLKILIDEIKLAGREVIIKGSYAALSEAIPKTKPLRDTILERLAALDIPTDSINQYRDNEGILHMMIELTPEKYFQLDAILIKELALSQTVVSKSEKSDPSMPAR